MNNLHRRRMQEKPYPPMVDYIREVVVEGASIKEEIKSDSGFVWAYYKKGNKFVYEKFKNGIITIDSNDVIFIGEGLSISTMHCLDKLTIFDASNSKTFKGVNNIYDKFIAGKKVELIDLTGCDKLKTIGLAGYGDMSGSWFKTITKEIRVNGCINATFLTGIGSISDAKIYGLNDCTKCSRILLDSLQPCNNSGEYITNLDLSKFEQLTELQISRATSITSLDNLPVGLTKLNCSNCAGVSSLDNLPNNLTTLDCSKCTSITSLDNLPSGLTTLNCSGTSITSLDNLPSGLTTLNCGSIKAIIDFSKFINLKEFNGYNVKFKDKRIVAPESLEVFISSTSHQLQYADFSKCSKLTKVVACHNSWVVGGLVVSNSIKTLELGTTWGSYAYPMPDLTACTNLTSINCQNCTNIPKLDQQAFIDSLPTFTDGSTHTINLKDTGVVAETVAAIQAKGWTVQV